MIQSAVKSKQHCHVAWTRERLLHECSLTMGQSIDISTWKIYGSALNSYLTFVQIHNFPVKPTPDTLSFFIVFMCHHIKPKSVNTYLSIQHLPSARTILPFRQIHQKLNDMQTDSYRLQTLERYSHET